MAARRIHDPHEVIIRTFKVGFGDCFLLTFLYEHTRDRHVLVDFGTMKSPVKNKPPSKLLVEVAETIATLTNGKLDAVVATHRHKDHIGGFGLNKAGQIIEDLKPSIVIQPWTEDPHIDEDATAPVRSRRRERNRLSQMNGFAEALFGLNDSDSNFLPDESFRHLSHLASADRRLFRKMTFKGADNVKNKKAVERLIRMGKAERAAFLHAKKKLHVKSILPGVTVDVLGPPTVNQYAGIKHQKHGKDDEFWNIQSAAAPNSFAGKGHDPFPGAPSVSPPLDALWSIRKLKSIRLEMVHNIVTALDKAMNNTSLILLFNAGEKSFLFPGDAQLENWEYAMGDEKVMKKLANVDVYKVGHHGSLNATPRTLWAKFNKTGAKSKKGRLISLLSSLDGKHGSKSRNTEVPRRTLVSALRAKSDLHSTQDLAPDEMYDEIRIPLK